MQVVCGYGNGIAIDTRGGVGVVSGAGVCGYGNGIAIDTRGGVGVGLSCRYLLMKACVISKGYFSVEYKLQFMRNYNRGNVALLYIYL